MLIREQGRDVKLLRLEPMPGTRRTRQVVIGVFPADADVPPQLLAALARDERRTLSQWLDAHRESRARERARPVLAGAQLQLEALVTALDVAADTLSPADADGLWAQLRAIAQSLRRGGHPKPTMSPRPPAPPPGQRDLIDELVTPSSVQSSLV